MSSLNIRENAAAPPLSASDRSHRASLVRRQAAGRRKVVLSVASGTVAAIAIAVGLPSMGIAVYLAATLPFAFFS
ncbi:hypothetical protein LFL96_27635 [Paraburkholderia sp. D15]|uniref:hypothetical protein n=1 Tax=Paraburkholderia sp. D15 TaxID=2880218 RepID=UPI00247A7A15|nr:hypothetical protein [Paraburkholderia sp. D15]WGS51982.1 hypothetical protein LFL96_27635 [Paraburkholderia sp. D15]